MLAGLIRQARTAPGGGVQGFQATDGSEPDITLISMEQGDGTASASGWRSMWHDGLRLGMGFHRVTSQPAGQSAILYTLEPEPYRLVSKVSSTFKMLNTTEDFQEVVTAGGSVSFEGWGANASASFSATSKVATKTNTISLCGQVMYRSEPMRVINPDRFISPPPPTPAPPSNADPQQPQCVVRLKPGVYALLKTEGPTKFHAEYGSHFVCGYTKGGFMAGYFCLEFNSREEAQSMEASVRAGFQAWGVSGEASANFKDDMQKLSAQTKTYGEYNGYGWSDSKVPAVVQGPEQLATALNGLPTDDGEALEAILCRYTDIPDYQAALSEYNAAQAAAGKPAETFEYFKEENYGWLVSRLNKEYLRYYCLRGVLLAEITAYENRDNTGLLGQLKPLLGRVQDVMDLFRTTFDDPTKALDALKNLQAYLLVPQQDADPSRRAAGIALQKQLWQADTLEAQVAALLATDQRPKPGIYKLHPPSKPNCSLDAATHNSDEGGKPGRRLLAFADNQNACQLWVLAHFRDLVTLHPHDNHDLYLSTSPMVQDATVGDKVTVEFNAPDQAQVWFLERAFLAKPDGNTYCRLRLPGSNRYLTVTNQFTNGEGPWVNTVPAWPTGGDQDPTLWRLQWVQGMGGAP